MICQCVPIDLRNRQHFQPDETYCVHELGLAPAPTQACLAIAGALPRRRNTSNASQMRPPHRQFQEAPPAFKQAPMTPKRPSSSFAAVTAAAEPGAKRRTPQAPRNRVGTDFSGMDTPVMAMIKLNIPVAHVFSSEVAEPCRKFIKRCFEPETVFSDIAEHSPPNLQAAPVHVYFSGFPCQPFSPLGHQQGAEDSKGRGLLALESLRYISDCKPEVFVLENVVRFASKRKDLHAVVTTIAKELGYFLEEGEIDTLSLGIPQSRARWYCVGIRLDRLRRRGALEQVFPEPASLRIPVEALVARVAPDRWLEAPPPEHAQGRENVLTAYAKAVAQGVNPFETPVIVDCNSSARFAASGVGFCPCITHCRGKQPNGYWCSTKGDYLDVDELAAFQGMKLSELDWQGAGVTALQIGGMLGNAMSLGVLLQLMPRVLFQAKFFDQSWLEAAAKQAVVGGTPVRLPMA